MEILKNKAKRDRTLNETIINGSKIYIEGGKVKTELSESIQKSGYMSPEEARQLLHTFVNKLEECYGKK